MAHILVPLRYLHDRSALNTLYIVTIVKNPKGTEGRRQFLALDL